MHRTLLTAFVLSLLLSACGGPGDSPEDTFNAMRNAARTENFGAMWDLMSPDSRTQFEEMARNPMMIQGMAGMLGKSPDEMKTMTAKDIFVAITSQEARKDPQFEQMKKAELLDVKVEGDKATVKYKAGDVERKETLVRVEGKWYVTMDRN